MNLVDFKALKLELASPETIKSWSHGEVTKPETINYRTLKPEKDGLFCERIFGPTRDWECYCGKYKRIRYRGIICDKCGVEVTQSRVRRERMGHIELATPVAHVWYFKGSSSKLALLLGISSQKLSSVIYFSRYLVLGIDEKGRKATLKKLEKEAVAKKKELEKKTKQAIAKKKKENENEKEGLKKRIKKKEERTLVLEELKLKLKKEIASLKDNLILEKQTSDEIYERLRKIIKKLTRLSFLIEDEYLKLAEHQAVDFLKLGMGTESILAALKDFNLQEAIKKTKTEAKKYSRQRRLRILKRLRLLKALKKAEIESEWMILRILPVIPPGLRPMVQLAGGRFASADLNDLYRRVINRNNRLKHLIDLGAPEIILRNEKRMLQEAVDALLDVPQTRRRRVQPGKELRSLSDMLKGKQGRFRRNLLGKRVDYSGRSVIVVGPELKLNQCGLPKDIALEMFKPYVLRELITRGLAPNVRSAKNVIERRPPEVFDILEKIIRNHPVLLNRAPTLHKLGIQAFYPILIEGDAIRIHPCVCAGFNADFDGDQMAVHVPLSQKAKSEAEEFMLPEKNLLKPADGSPITIPSKEIALGCYWLTSLETEKKSINLIFSDINEALLAHEVGKISLRQSIKVKINDEILETSVGRLILNEVLPKRLGFLNLAIQAADIKDLIRKALRFCSQKEVVKLIDDLKELGFYYATLSGVSVAVNDCHLIPEKEKIIENANKKVAQINKNYEDGLITEQERRRLSNDIWLDTTEDIAEKTWHRFEPANSVRIIIDSGGTRASRDQVKQLSAMRGLVVDPLGNIVELPTKSNFREGLSIFEYVTSTRGSRKGLTDSALKTADAGYLTRRLIDVAHDAIIRQEDCGTKEEIKISQVGARKDKFFTRILGRILAANLLEPKNKRKVLAKKGDLIDDALIETLMKKKITQVTIYSPLTCQAKYGLCAKCYGWDLSSRRKAEIGTPVGILAAQSVGEPGTQLTLRVKHTGGIVGLDVTQGLPRVEELFELRSPKGLSPLAEIAGKVSVKETDDGYEVTIKSTDKKSPQIKTYHVPLTSSLRVKKDDLISAGEQLASGSLDINDILRIRGLREAQLYLLSEIQKVYESQGIPIHDKHFEVIINKMTEKVRIIDQGDTSFLPGELATIHHFEKENQETKAEKNKPATAKRIILGITQASLRTDSWLSAASFQETTNILTDASLRSDVDELIGLKENVIIGRLIPTSPERAKIEEE